MLTLTQLENRDCPSLVATLDTNGTLFIDGRDGIAHSIHLTTWNKTYDYLNINGPRDLVLIADADSDVPITVPLTQIADGTFVGPQPILDTVVKRIEIVMPKIESYLWIDSDLNGIPITVNAAKGVGGDLIVVDSDNVTVKAGKKDTVIAVNDSTPTVTGTNKTYHAHTTGDFGFRLGIEVDGDYINVKKRKS